VTLPSGGFTIDALAMDGRMTVPDGLLEVTTRGTEQRASGVVSGGGPAMTLLSSRGEIALQTKKPDM
jgi:hypothetical protein